MATAASGSYCAVKGFMLITSAFTGFIISVDWAYNADDVVKGWQQNICHCFARGTQSDLVDGFCYGRTGYVRRIKCLTCVDDFTKES